MNYEEPQFVKTQNLLSNAKIFYSLDKNIVDDQLVRFF